MILILEDDGDREAYSDGSFIGMRWAEDAVGRTVRVWISPEEYHKSSTLWKAPLRDFEPDAHAKEVVLADLREKVEALRHDHPDTWVCAACDQLDDVLALIDGEQR